MKKLILLLFIPLVFACSSDDNNETPPEPSNFLKHTMVYGLQPTKMAHKIYLTFMMMDGLYMIEKQILDAGDLLHH